MKNSRFHFAICVFVLLIFLSACSGTSANQAPTITAQPSIQLTPCGVGAHKAMCGTLSVYENRAAQSGRKIDLKIVVIKAMSSHPAPDPIFYLAGGPGGAATEDAKGDPIPSSLIVDHDVVFVDQRGTGGSNRVMVPTDPPDVSGLSPEQIDAAYKAWVADYLAQIDMDPRYYTTSIAMDDLDEVRQALGYDKINLVGYSYGATAAQYYLRQHEEHVRTVTLGVGSLLDIPVFERWAYSSQRALDRVFELCQADPDCQAAFPNLKAEFAALMDQLAAQPLTLTYNDLTSKQLVDITLTADYFAAVVRHMMKNASHDASLPLFIHLAYQDNVWKGFIDFIAQEGGSEWWGDQIMERIIRCSEKWASFDSTVVAQLSQGSFVSGWDINLSQMQAASCQYTPAGETPEGSTPQPGSQVPVLVWNGVLDPIDPPENMAGAQDLWPNGAVLVTPYQGHVFSGDAAHCFTSVMEEFIDSGTAEGLHTDCLQNSQPPKFLLP